MFSYKSGLLSLAVLLLVACVTPQEVVNINARPAWIDNPGNGVSASSGFHVGGRVKQEELAVLRAREEYAKRFGVDVMSEEYTSTRVNNQHASTTGDKQTQVNTNQKNVKAMVKEKWRDPNSDVLWVWLVPSDK